MHDRHFFVLDISRLTWSQKRDKLRENVHSRIWQSNLNIKLTTSENCQGKSSCRLVTWHREAWCKQKDTVQWNEKQHSMCLRDIYFCQYHAGFSLQIIIIWKKEKNKNRPIYTEVYWVSSPLRTLCWLSLLWQFGVQIRFKRLNRKVPF